MNAGMCEGTFIVQDDRVRRYIYEDDSIFSVHEMFFVELCRQGPRQAADNLWERLKVVERRFGKAEATWELRKILIDFRQGRVG